MAVQINAHHLMLIIATLILLHGDISSATGSLLILLFYQMCLYTIYSDEDCLRGGLAELGTRIQSKQVQSSAGDITRKFIDVMFF